MVAPSLVFLKSQDVFVLISSNLQWETNPGNGVPTNVLTYMQTARFLGLIDLWFFLEAGQYY